MRAEPIRVVRILARLNVGGPTRHVVWLTAALNDGAFRTTLITGVVPPGEDDMSDFAQRHGVEPRVIREMSRELSPRDVVTIWKLYRAFRELRPDIIHTHTAKAGAAGRIAALLYRWLTPSALLGRPRRVSLVHTFHGHVFHSYYGALKTRLFLTIEKILARWTDVIVTITEQQRHEIHETFGVGRAEQFRVIRLGLDLDDCVAGAGERESNRDGVAAARHTTIVGIVGRVTAIKNHPMFLRVAGARRWPAGVQFVVYGDGADRPRLERHARDASLAGVVFAGTRDAREIYAAVDVAALTSLNEGTPLTLIEAMANGIPCISTSVGGVVDVLGDVREVVRDESGATYEIRERGITAASNDVGGFAAGLARILEDDTLRAHLAERGRIHAHATYSKDRLVADIIALYHELAGRGRRS